MSNYPDGFSQIDHDQAFDAEPAEDPGAAEDREYQDYKDSQLPSPALVKYEGSESHD